MATYVVCPPQQDHTGHYIPQQLPRNPPSRNQRPKLSLNTSLNRSFGKGSASLRLDSLATSSPTSCNTYKNVFNTPAQAARSQTSSILSPLSQSVGDANEKPNQLTPDATDNSSMEQPAPYSLPPYARSILTNGPFGKRYRQTPTPSSSSSASSCSSTSLPSSAKRVCFRDPLSEEIENTEYLLCHSDIPSRSSSPAPGAKESNTSSETSIHEFPTSARPLPKTREMALKVIQPEIDSENSSEELDERSDADDDSSNSPATPVSSTFSRDSRWVWTLGPLTGANGPGSAKNPDPLLEEDLEDSLGETVAAASAYCMS